MDLSDQGDAGHFVVWICNLNAEMERICVKEIAACIQNATLIIKMLNM